MQTFRKCTNKYTSSNGLTTYKCGHLNPKDARACNHCGRALVNTGMFGSDHYEIVWKCEKCGQLNMIGNSSCMCGASKPSSGCFLTTLTHEILKKPDNSTELETFRDFRDNYLAKTKDGQKLLDDYKIYSEKLVPIIRQDENKISLAKNMFDDYIRVAVRLLNDNKYETAIELYSEMVYMLLDKYKIKELSNL
jgi:hypothetical protein